MTPRKRTGPKGGNPGAGQKSAVVGADGTNLPVTVPDVFAPAGERRWWWVTYRCPHCGRVHFGRSRTLVGLSGVRRSGCGRPVRLSAGGAL